MPFFRPQIPYHENTKCNVFNEPPDGFPMTLTFKYYCSDLRAMTLVQYYHKKRFTDTTKVQCHNNYINKT